MKKIIIKILTFLILFYTIPTYALDKVWDLNIDVDYTVSDTNTTVVSWWLGQLKMLLNHEWKINNGTTYNWAYDVVVDGIYAYMTNYNWDRITIINISNPTNPVFVSQLINNNWTIRLDWASGIIKDWNYLYIWSNVSDALQIIDVSNPLSPIQVWQIRNTTTLNGARWLAKSWNYVYLTTDRYDAVQVINVSNPASPTIVWTIRDTTNLNWARDIKISWNYAYVSAYDWDRFTVIDISNPNSPTVVSNIRDATNLNWAWWLEISWNYAYVSSYLNWSVRVIDISNPLSPTAITNISGWNFSLTNPRDLLIDWNYIYISSFWNDAINIADISNPSNPIFITKILHNAANPLLDWAYWLFKVWNLLYVSSYNSDALEILKIVYDSNSPNIIPNENLLYSWSIDKITTTFWFQNQWIVTYQISKDNWLNWYYLNWTTRTITTSWANESNSSTQINSEIQTFNWLAWWTWEFIWKVFLTSDWNQKVEIDEIKVDYTSAWTNEIIDFELPWGYTVTNWTWTRVTSDFYEWAYSIESDNWWANNSISCFEVNRDVYLDSTIDFYKKVDSEAWYDFLRFYIDNIKYDEWAWNITRWQNSYDVTNWNHTFKWCYEKDWSVNNWSDKAWVDYIEIKEVPAPPVEVVVLDFEVTWWYNVTTTVTPEDWKRVTTEKYEWLYSLESQNRTDNTMSCFERVQTVWITDTWISFYKKVSSESWYDYLRFYIDWIVQNSWAWEIAWSKETYSLSGWTYTLRWCYQKDGSVANWDDRARIDLVSVTQDPPIISEITPVATPTNDNTPDYTFNTPIAWTISYGWSCTSTTNTTAVIWNNTITFDNLADWIYTDCTIQVLASPENTTVLNVSNFTVDTTWIDIIFNNPVDWWSIAQSPFNIDISYSDINWVNTSTIDLKLFEWNWTSYWSDIAWTYINFWWATITPTWAIFPTSTLNASTQYKIEFSMDDNIWNNSIATSVFTVLSWDTTAPSIINNFPLNWIVYPNSDFDISIDYNDSESWINTSSIIMDIKKWDWSTYWVDISWSYITWNTITSTNALYNVSKLWFWKYKLYFYIEDNTWNSNSSSIEFYIDEPELIVSSWSIDIWNIENNITKFSTQELNITVKTVWAWFDLILNKANPLIKWTVEIEDWNGTTWVWYDKNPYSSTINLINTNEIIASQTWSININWDKNIYVYNIKLWAKVSEEQEAWEYNSWINFWIILDY